MAATVPPVAASVLSLIVKYIVPTGEPVPAHLLSSALRQRHNFLAIDPTDAQNYLTWPAEYSDPAKIVSVLDSISAPDIEESASSIPVRYTADAAPSVFAHASIHPAIRLVFVWEPDGWKFHNASPMPWPPNCHLSPDDAILKAQSSPVHDSSFPPTTSMNDSDQPEDNSYWDSYNDDLDGHSDSGSPLRRQASLEVNEDAYWNMYNGIHGSADSTIPSPLPAKRRTLLPESSANRASEPDHSLQKDALLDRLVELSSTKHLLGPSEVPQSPGAIDVPQHPTSESHLFEIQPTSLLSAAENNLVPNHIEPKTKQHPSTNSDAALKQAIVGAYGLWKNARSSSSQGGLLLGEKDEFVRLVREAIS